MCFGVILCPCVYPGSLLWYSVIPAEALHQVLWYTCLVAASRYRQSASQYGDFVSGHVCTQGFLCEE